MVCQVQKVGVDSTKLIKQRFDLSAPVSLISVKFLGPHQFIHISVQLTTQFPYLSLQPMTGKYDHPSQYRKYILANCLNFDMQNIQPIGIRLEPNRLSENLILQQYVEYTIRHI